MGNLDVVGAIITALLAFVGAFLTYRTARIEGEAKSDREMLATLSETYERLTDQHQEEIDRHRDQRSLDRKEAEADRGRLLEKQEALEAQIKGMERLYREESNRWATERADLIETAEAQGVEIKELKARNQVSQDKLIDLIDQSEARAQERAKLTAQLEASEKEIARLTERILLLETARQDGGIPVISRESLPE